MKKAIACFVLAFVVPVFAPLAEAQKPGKVYRVGLLSYGTPSAFVGRFQAFREELHSRGYMEAQNIQFEYRYAEGREDRLPGLAAELVRLKVDVIVSTNTSTTRAAMKAGPTIPIVMQAGAPVETGLVASLSHPGGNVTGVTVTSGLAFRSKHLELLKEIAPSAQRVAVLWNPANPSMRVQLKALRAVALALGLTLYPVSTLRDGAENIESTLTALRMERPEALIAFGSVASGKYLKRQIVEFVAQNRIPAAWPSSRWMKVGGLMALGVDMVDIARHKAIYVDKILKGTKPADLPVERPRKYNLFINLKTAKKLGITIPPEVLLRATKVIR